MNEPVILEITNDLDLPAYVRVIRESFATVAKDFNLTETNSPTNPAFITLEKLLELKVKGVKFFGVLIETQPVGFAAVEKASDQVFYLEKLAVLPEFRHLGLGRILMDRVLEYVKTMGGTMVSIGIVNENEVLKKWYQTYGFNETGLKKFTHLPFYGMFFGKEDNLI